MTAWFRAYPPTAGLPDQATGVLFADPVGQRRFATERQRSLGDRLDSRAYSTNSIRSDGWAELLVHSPGGPRIGSARHRGRFRFHGHYLYLYSDLALIAMKTPLRRDSQAPESCLDP